MVAAGAYLLVRLQPVLDAVGWFAPATITIGLATALAGGAVAVQDDAKKLLAASTSAQYGFLLVAVGRLPRDRHRPPRRARAGQGPVVRVGPVAISATGTRELARLGLGGDLAA